MPNQRPPAPPPLAGYRPSVERGPAPPQARRGPPPPGHQQGQPRGKAGGPPPRRRSGLLSALLGFLVVIVSLAGAGAAYLVLNPPSDLIRQTLADQVKEKTGRDLIVAGPASFSFWPGLGVSLKDVTLSGPPGSPNKLVSMASLDVNIKTMPLLQRQVEVRRLVLKKPVFDFRVDKQGRKNWQLADAGAPVRYAQAAAPQPAAGAAPTATDAPPAQPENPALAAKLAQIKHVQLGDVRIEDGTLRYTDERSGKTQAVSAVNVQVAMQSLNSPVTAKGDLAWQGEKINFDGKLSTANLVLQEKPAQLVFKAQNRNIDASYDGAVHIHDGADLEGKITAKSESVKSLAKWLGSTLPPVSGFGPLSIAGTLKTNGNVTSLSSAQFGLDGATGNGNVTVTTGGIRPAVQASLKLSELDLNKYMIGAAGAASAPAPQPAKKPAAAGAPATPGDKAGAKGGDAIEELLQVPAGGPKVHGYTERTGWSSEPLNLTLFGVVDADAKLQIGRLLYQDIKIGQSALTVALKNKVMKTSFDNVQLYEGQGTGLLNVDGTGKAAQVGANFVLDGLSALPFLKDAADMDWLAGKTKLTLQLAAQGGSQLQLVETLNGKADFTFANGAIVGFNLPGAIRGISQGKLSGLKKAPAEKTDFSELAASFTIANGIAQNQDLRLTSPLLRVTGAGAIQLPPKTVDYTVKPKLVASLEGQQGAADLSGLEIPVRISGPWDKPKYEPDLKGVLADPNKAIEAVKQIGKQFKGKDAKAIADELLGKKGAGGATGSTQKAKDLLKNLLKPQ
jgi:AsmA protein